jgi:hypothetical protein
VADLLTPSLPPSLTAAELLVEISRCGIMEAHLEGRGEDHPCREVVLHQWANVGDEGARAVRWRREHHLPEPWLGHLDEAPILFVSSNPNLGGSDLRPSWLDGPIPDPEPIPSLGASRLDDHASLNKPFRAAKANWSDSEIVDVFDNSFDVWVKPDGVRRYSKDPSRRAKAVPYWEFALAQARVLFPSAVPGRHYALTEVVHCKSAREAGVESALRPCVTGYLKAVLRTSPASVIFVVGTYAARAVEILEPSLLATELAPSVKVGRPGQCVRASLGGRERALVYVPHPSWLRRNPVERARYELPGLLDPVVLDELCSSVTASSEGRTQIVGEA